PATAAGKITEVKVSEGSKVSEGDVIVTVEAVDDDGESSSGSESPASEDAGDGDKNDEPAAADESVSETVEVKVPDIGESDAVEVIEVLIAHGDQVEEEQTLITLESDKATLEV